MRMIGATLAKMSALCSHQTATAPSASGASRICAIQGRSSTGTGSSPDGGDVLERGPLVPEVDVDGLHRDAGAGRDLLERGDRVPVGHEQLGGSGDDPAPCGSGLGLPFVFLPHGIAHAFIVSEGSVRGLQITSPAGFEELIADLGEPAEHGGLPTPSAPDVPRLLQLPIATGTTSWARP